MARILVTGPELAALFPPGVSDQVMAAFAVYRLSDDRLRDVGASALATRASRSAEAASAVATLTTRIERALESCPDVVRVQDRDGDESWTTVLLGWGAVQVTTDNAGWYLAEDFEPNEAHTPGGLAAALPDRPARLVERFSETGRDVLGHHQGWTATFDRSEQVWKQVTKEEPRDFATRVATWLGAGAA